jgi:hypothetical protein
VNDGLYSGILSQSPPHGVWLISRIARGIYCKWNTCRLFIHMRVGWDEIRNLWGREIDGNLIFFLYYVYMIFFIDFFVWGEDINFQPYVGMEEHEIRVWMCQVHGNGYWLIWTIDRSEDWSRSCQDFCPRMRVCKLLKLFETRDSYSLFNSTRFLLEEDAVKVTRIISWKVSDLMRWLGNPVSRWFWLTGSGSNDEFF